MLAPGNGADTYTISSTNGFQDRAYSRVSLPGIFKREEGVPEDGVGRNLLVPLLKRDEY